MRDSARLHLVIDQSDGLSSASGEIVNSYEGAAPANLVEEIAGRSRLYSDDGAMSSVVFEALVDAPEGAAVAASADVT